MRTTKKARSWAVLLSLILPGLGHLYLGRWLRGFLCLGATVALLELLESDLPLEALAAGELPPTIDRVLVELFALLALLCWCLWDTLRIARAAATE